MKPRPVFMPPAAHRRRPRPAFRSSPVVAGIPPVEPPIARELAGLAQTSRFHFRQGEIQPPSEILRKRSKPGMRHGELWDHMITRDAFLGGLWMKRWKAVLGLPRYILPRDETPVAKEMASFCRLALRDVPSFHVNLRHQFEAVTHGWSAEEIMWQLHDRGPIQGKWGLDLVDRPMWRFLYKEEDGCLYVRRPDGKHVLAPPGKFLVNRTGSKDNPWGGLGLLDYIYWYWFAGEHGWKYFAVLIEKWAQPTAVGKYRRTLDTALDQGNVSVLFEAIDRIQTEYSIVIPDDLVVELLEARRGGEVSYDVFIRLANLAKALIFLGEADTSGFEQGHGSFARRSVSNQVRLETIRIDAHELDAHLTDNLLRLLVEVNFGPEAPVPVWYTEVDDAEDLAMRQERADAMLDRGLPLPLEDYYRVNKQRLPRVGESILRARTAGSLEVVDPPDGFEISGGDRVEEPRNPADEERDVDADATAQLLPFTASAHSALRHYRSGDIHDYLLAA